MRVIVKNFSCMIALIAVLSFLIPFKSEAMQGRAMRWGDVDIASWKMLYSRLASEDTRKQYEEEKKMGSYFVSGELFEKVGGEYFNTVRRYWNMEVKDNFFAAPLAVHFRLYSVQTRVVKLFAEELSDQDNKNEAITKIKTFLQFIDPELKKVEIQLTELRKKMGLARKPHKRELIAAGFRRRRAERVPRVGVTKIGKQIDATERVKKLLEVIKRAIEVLKFDIEKGELVRFPELKQWKKRRRETTKPE